MPSPIFRFRLLVGVAFLVGVGLRVCFLDYETPDVPEFLLPWYDFARDHGVGALAYAFTNYAPFYSYLLIGATWFGGWAAPLTLIKFISYPFEFGSAVIAARLVAVIDPRPERSLLAFTCVWLAPSVLHNGAFWGQCDAIWTFFLLLSLLFFCRESPGRGAVTFGLALSVKAQAVFLGPLLLALALRRNLHWGWFLVIPVIYFATALPTLIVGRPVAEIALIYFGQAGAYESLSKRAANLYLMIPDSFYGPGLAIGLAATVIASLWFANRVARAPRLPPEHLMLAAAVTLVMAPFLLPKMHERFFYPFEILVIALACARPVLVPVAVMTQITSLLSYLPYDGRGRFTLPLTGMIQLVILLFLSTLLIRALRGEFGRDGQIRGDTEEFLRPAIALWFSFAVYMALLWTASLWVDVGHVWPHVPVEAYGFLAFLSILLARLAFLARERSPRLSKAASAG
jgi:Gpi18-like mannosyltransferase